MTEQMNAGINVVSAPVSGKEPTLGARFLASLFDLIIVPIILGVVFGLLFFAAPPALRNVVLIFVNVAWTCLRDMIGGAGPGKRMAKIKVISVDNGGVPTLRKLIIRNLLIWIPFVLMIGFPIEVIRIFIMKKDRLGDLWAKTKVVSAN